MCDAATCLLWLYYAPLVYVNQLFMRWLFLPTLPASSLSKSSPPSLISQHSWRSYLPAPSESLGRISSLVATLIYSFIVLRRRRFANIYWSRYGSLLVWGSNHYKFAHETTIGLAMDDYWFGYKRLLVYRSKDYSVSLPSVASSISTGGMFLCAVSHRASHRLEG